MKFKQYQLNALEKLGEFIGLLKKLKPKLAFHELTDKNYNYESFGDIPFVCIKIPTGGGKTLVASKSVELVMSTWLQHKMDTGIVMWFVPSDAIKTQTLKKLNDKDDWHRQILDEAFENKVRIFSNEDALAISKEDVRENLCIVISSLDAFRKDATIQKKYKVYKENGALMHHFQNLKDDIGLEKDSEHTVINSLANVIRKSNPLIVIDEGHHTQTELSISFLADLKPSFILEFTATPRDGSNVLVDISTAELKAEEMVKIPIVLQSRTQWEQIVADGIRKRKELENHALMSKKEYIRPIALLQAQPKSKTRATVTVEQLKAFLLVQKIPENQIAIKTGEINDLKGINLFDKSCEIRFIITVNALAEGWDCSMAYVLISVANLGARVAVEQIIGRVIRMPYARRKREEALNRSYVFASAANFSEAAERVIKGLKDNGYGQSDFVSEAEEKSYTDPLEAKKAIKANLSIPLMALGKEKLSFEDLLGDKFELAKQNADFKFDIHYDLDGQAVIDISEEDEWMQGKQLSLPFRYLENEHSLEELVMWLDKKLRFPMLEREDKVAFIEKAVQNQIKKYKRTLPELSVNRYLLANRMGIAITQLLETYTKDVFGKLLKTKKISVRPFDAFPPTISLKAPVPKEFNKNLYERIDSLNGEERALVERLDLEALGNIQFWVRNREKIDPFYIQGWKKGKFYPDFIVVTKKGGIAALEWKGEDRISNEDTTYKVEIAKEWEKLGKGKLHFFLVHNGNVEEVLSGIKRL
ncbi:MAG: putative type III restriction enzyme [Candidatus Kaiserbacteria bacterium GW2011_GWA2_52_12]|uniref:Putative type III restriction enzyme n=1 Tax=Candidatus Kaiserbacteria bacterium GW2011_GWA2_52_12 TaxID=1618671 RepID=A0A0G1WWJ3_9BACT|nr:MAG: putative type III restriction enzyme [Candidatus Kaiserbacteria bacterium GW2011_GWA2_52_12]